MTSSLVGSEMCIRDRCCTAVTARRRPATNACWPYTAPPRSYPHATNPSHPTALPTACLHAHRRTMLPLRCPPVVGSFFPL
eukprot:7675339-Prorocentrum_lima.AAC.1